MSDPVRYRLIPARGLSHPSRHVWGDATTAREAAEALAEEFGMPVVVCEAPPDGLVRHLFTVDGPDSVKRSVRRAA